MDRLRTRVRQGAGARGGACEIKGPSYTEKNEFASQEVESIAGKTFVFQIKVEGDKLHQSGSIGDDVTLEETWRKATTSNPPKLVTRAEMRSESKTPERD